MKKFSKPIFAIFIAITLLLSTVVISYACDDRDPRSMETFCLSQTIMNL